MLRKTVLKGSPAKLQPRKGELDVAAVASVIVSSEDSHHPIDNAFDRNRGPGGSEWVAEDAGGQSIVLAFNSPQAIRRIAIEVEEKQAARSQEVQVLVSRDQEFTYDSLLHQGFNFSPPGTQFEREQWDVDLTGITHLQLRIMPDTAGKPRHARLTTFDIW